MTRNKNMDYNMLNCISMHIIKVIQVDQCSKSGNSDHLTNVVLRYGANLKVNKALVDKVGS